jgi:hypothetical protein
VKTTVCGWDAVRLQRGAQRPGQSTSRDNIVQSGEPAGVVVIRRGPRGFRRRSVTLVPSG